MNLLLDTCTFLWAIQSPDQLSARARSLIVDPDNAVYFSAVSAWEISVKAGYGALRFSEPVAQALPHYREQHDFSSLPLDEESVLQLPKLPTPHRDPFDRMLVCQAVAHGLVIVTPDEKIAQYPVRVDW